MEATAQDLRYLRHIRGALALFIIGLIISGVTAFPLQTELDLAAKWLGLERVASSGGGLADAARWVLRVREGLRVTYANYPFIAYGTDWLAFGHLVIALFFVPPWIDPVKNIAALQVGLWACVLVLPLALICGPLRGVPFFWRLIDCSFGVLGFPLLWYAYRLTARLAGKEIPTASRSVRRDAPPRL